MRSTTLEQLSAADAEAILKYLPERIRAALLARAAEIEYPIEIVVEMAIANFQGQRSTWRMPIANRGEATKESELEIREL